MKEEFGLKVAGIGALVVVSNTSLYSGLLIAIILLALDLLFTTRNDEQVYKLGHALNKWQEDLEELQNDLIEREAQLQYETEFRNKMDSEELNIKGE